MKQLWMSLTIAVDKVVLNRKVREQRATHGNWHKLYRRSEAIAAPSERVVAQGDVRAGFNMHTRRIAGIQLPLA